MCFKQKVFGGRNTKKWGLGWWSAQIKVDANYKKGSLCQGRRRKAPENGRTILTVIFWCSINSFWYFLQFTILSLGATF